MSADSEERVESNLMKIFDPEGGFIKLWNKRFSFCSVIALSLDPLFLYIPIIEGTQKCLDMDHDWETFVCVLRSIVDIFYVFHIFIQFRTRNNVEPKGYPTSRFIMDVLAALPLPQLTVWVIIPHFAGQIFFLRENLLKFVIFSQYIARVIHVHSFYNRTTIDSGPLIKKAWAGAGFNFFLYVLASHALGALWYFFAIESELRCWHIACKSHKCQSMYLYCGEGRVGDNEFLKTSCPLLESNEIKNSTNFDFGIFLEALQTRVLETRDYRKKIMYCSWWGLKNLSSLGQGLKTSTYYGEILFAIFVAVIGLALFALLIGNMQMYLQSYSNLTLTMEEKKEKRQESEDLMSFMCLPEELRQRVRKHKQYQWKTTRGFDLDQFVKDLPKDLRKDIKRRFFISLLKRVPMFYEMNDQVLGVMSKCLKAVLYKKGSFLLRVGKPVQKMLFITDGEVLSVTTNGGKTGFFNASNLKDGDFCGEELLTWALDDKSQLPLSTRTLSASKDVQAYALEAKELKSVVSRFSLFNDKHLQHTLRFYSPVWKWAAYFIQVAWRRHCKKKHDRIVDANKRLQDAFGTGSKTSTPSLGASINKSRFYSSVLRVISRRNNTYNVLEADPC